MKPTDPQCRAAASDMMPPPASSGPELILARAGASRLAERLAALGTKRVLVLSSPSRRFVDRIIAELRAFEPTVFDGARVHVPAEVRGCRCPAVADAAADTLVAVGGGSAIGLAKALRLTAPIRFAAIPTTYSGSEMTSMWGITRTDPTRTQTRRPPGATRA